MATRVIQEFRHDPDNGVIGDCWRTCIASVLGLERSRVPHFMKDLWPNLSNGRPLRATNNWLGRGGLQMRRVRSDRGLRGFYMASGRMPSGWRHIVVYLGQKLWWNPHPGEHDSDIAADCFYVVAPLCFARG